MSSLAIPVVPSRDDNLRDDTDNVPIFRDEENSSRKINNSSTSVSEDLGLGCYIDVNDWILTDCDPGSVDVKDLENKEIKDEIKVETKVVDEVKDEIKVETKVVDEVKDLENKVENKEVKETKVETKDQLSRVKPLINLTNYKLDRWPKVMHSHELIDLNRCYHLIQHADKYRPLLRAKTLKQSEDPFTHLQRYLDTAKVKRVHNAGIVGVVETSYQQSTKGLGRYFVEKGLGLSNICREFRHTIAHRSYVDIDMVNAHPVILQFMCQERKIDCPRLTEYINDRESILAELGCERDSAKKVFLTVLNGKKGVIDWICRETKCTKTRFLRRFTAEVYKIRQSFIELYAKDYRAHVVRKKKANKKDNFDGSFMNILFCEMENVILQCMTKWIIQHNQCEGYSDWTSNYLRYPVYCFDGIMVSGRVDGTVLRQMGQFIKEHVGIDMKLAVKPIDKGFDIDDDDLEEYPGITEFKEEEKRPLVEPIDAKYTEEDYNLLRKNDKGMTHLYVKYNYDSVRFTIDKSFDTQLFIYDEKSALWVNTPIDHLANYVIDFLEEVCEERLAVEDAKRHPDGNVMKVFNRILSTVRSFSKGCTIAKMSKKLLFDPNFMSCLHLSKTCIPIKNGRMVDLEDLLVRPRTKEDMVSQELNVDIPEDITDLNDWEEKHGFDNVNKLLNPIVGYDPDFDDLETDDDEDDDYEADDDEEKRTPEERNNDALDIKLYLQEALGCSLLYDPNRQVYILHGWNGKNAKSAIARPIRTIFASTGKVLNKGVLISTGSKKFQSASAHTSHLMPLDGLRFGLTEELNEDDVLNSDVFKNLADGGTIAARACSGKREVELKIRGKFYVCTNHQPKFNVEDQAVIDRLVYIPFTSRFVTDSKLVNHKKRVFLADPAFANSFLSGPNQTELFVWLCHGACSTLQYNDHRGVPLMRNVISKYSNKSVEDIDYLRQFIKDKCEEGKGEKVKAGVFYNSYCNWCYDEHRLTITDSKTKLTQDMKKRGYPIKRSAGSWYMGLRIKPVSPRESSTR